VGRDSRRAGCTCGPHFAAAAVHAGNAHGTQDDRQRLLGSEQGGVEVDLDHARKYALLEGDLGEVGDIAPKCLFAPPSA
jgi:hypothetical protein